MVSLIARTPLDGLLPLTIGTCSLTELSLGPISSLAPFGTTEAAFGDALQAAHGLPFPAPNRVTANGTARAIWSGRNQAFLVGVAADARLSGQGAVTDQTDGWAVMRLEGIGAGAVLARLIPLDLRPEAFGEGHAARTSLLHVNCLIWREAPQAFGIMVMRSYGVTAVHELETAMQGFAARG